MPQTSPQLHIFLGRHESSRSGMWINAIAVSEALNSLLGQKPNFVEPTFSYAGSPQLVVDVAPLGERALRVGGLCGSRRGGFLRDLLRIVPANEVFHGMSNFVPFLGGGKIILTLHDLLQGYPQTPPRSLYERCRVLWYRFLLYLMVARSDRIITDHPETAQQICRRLGSRLTPRIVYPPLQQSYLQAPLPDESARGAKRVLVFTGQDPRKNLEGALRAYSASDLSADHLLTIFSGSSRSVNAVEERVRRVCSELGGGLQWELLSAVPVEQMPTIFRQARAVLFPSLAEGFGYPIYEALSQGVPAVCDGALVLPECRKYEGELLFYATPTDSQAVTRALNQLAARSPSVESRRRAAQEVRALLSAERAAAELLSIYKELVEAA